METCQDEVQLLLALPLISSLKVIMRMDRFKKASEENLLYKLCNVTLSNEEARKKMWRQSNHQISNHLPTVDVSAWVPGPQTRDISMCARGAPLYPWEDTPPSQARFTGATTFPSWTLVPTETTVGPKQKREEIILHKLINYKSLLKKNATYVLFKVL